MIAPVILPTIAKIIRAVVSSKDVPHSLMQMGIKYLARNGLKTNPLNIHTSHNFQD